jgi:hypothetical protein
MWLHCLNFGLEAMAREGSHTVGSTIRQFDKGADLEDGGQYNRRPAGTAHAGGRIGRDVRRTDTSLQKCCGSSGTSLSLSAIRLSAGSERAFIFRIRRLRCTFTVASAMPMSPAICLLRRPRAT